MIWGLLAAVCQAMHLCRFQLTLLKGLLPSHSTSGVLAFLNTKQVMLLHAELGERHVSVCQEHRPCASCDGLLLGLLWRVHAGAAAREPLRSDLARHWQQRRGVLHQSFTSPDVCCLACHTVYNTYCQQSGRPFCSPKASHHHLHSGLIA